MVARRWILHIDMDSFFVSVERVLNPSLKGKAVIVGGDPRSRGVVSSASYEARVFGIHAGMPASQAYRLCPGAIFLPINGEKYGEFSEKIQGIFEGFSPSIEMSSLDEAYLDLTGTERLFGHPLKVAEKIHRKIETELGLPCSCGLGGNKLIGKVATDVAKPNGLVWVISGYEREFLAPLSLSSLPGIGKQSAETLSRFGLKTIGDLRNLGEWNLRDVFGETGRILFQRACGIDEEPIKPVRKTKSVGREHTFEQDICSPEILHSALCYLAEYVGKSLREIRAKAKTITVKLRFSDFKTITRSQTLYYPTDDDSTILQTAKGLFSKTFSRRVRIRLLGISASNLFTQGWEIDLFEKENLERLERLYYAIDKIKTYYGFKSICRAQSLVFLSKRK